MSGDQYEVPKARAGQGMTLTVTPWGRTAPMPTKHSSSRVTPSSIALCPTVTLLPITVGARGCPMKVLPVPTMVPS